MLQVHDNVNYFRPKLPLNLKGVKVRYFHVHIHIYTLRTLIIYTHNHFRPKIARKTSELALSLSLSQTLPLKLSLSLTGQVHLSVDTTIDGRSQFGGVLLEVADFELQVLVDLVDDADLICILY